MEKFYDFGSRGYLTTFAASPDLFEDAINKDLCGFHSGRKIHDQLVFRDQYPNYIQFPIVFRHIDGKRMRDLLDMRYTGSHFLISDRLKSILEENRFTGWKCYPIELYDKKGNPISGYSGFTVTGRGGRLYYSFNKGWDTIGEDYLGWNPACWDGSDFFRFDNTRHLLVTEKVMTVMKKNRVDAVDYFSLGDSHIHYDPSAGKREAGYAVFATVRGRPQSYQKPPLNGPVDGEFLSRAAFPLKAGTLACLENCLELMGRYGNAGRSASHLSLLDLESEAKTELRCYRHVALIESLDCCADAIECLDNAAYMLHCESDSPALMRRHEFPSIPDYHTITSGSEWDRFMDWHIATLRALHIDIYNALTKHFEHLKESGRMTPLIQQYLEKALMQLTQSISILSEACAAGIL